MKIIIFSFVTFIAIISGCSKTSTTVDSQNFKLTDFSFDKKNVMNQGKYINMFSNSELSVDSKLSKPGNYKLTIRAKGSTVEKGWPKFDLLVNGKKVGESGVDSSEFSDKTFNLNLETSENKITIKFTNDAFNAKTKEDRNLYIESMKLDLVN